MNKRLSLLWLLMVLAKLLPAQMYMNKDSLLRLLPSAKEDTNKVLLYINIGQQYENNEPEVAKGYYRAARELSRRLHYQVGELKFISNYGYILNMQGYYDSTLTLNLQAITLARQLKDSFLVAKMLANTGSSYQLLDNYELSNQYYQQARILFERYGDKAMMAQMDDISQCLYTAMRQYQKGIAFGVRAVAGFKETGNLLLLGTAYNNLGMNYRNFGLEDSAFYCYQQALQIALQTEDKNMESAQYMNLATAYQDMHRLDSVRILLLKALALANELGLYETKAIACKGLGWYYLNTLELDKAKQYADTAQAICLEYGYKRQREKVLSLLADIAYAMHNIPLANEYDAQSIALADILLSEDILETTLSVEKKYETEKKDNLLALQRVQLRQKNTVNYILIAGAVALLIILLLGYRNYKSKQKLQQQRISELETEKQLMATEAVLKGEEQERARLAKDLHDGLGGMLSGIRHSFATVKGNLVMTTDNQQAFEHSMTMLDSSIREMRRVAHNMMPEALVKYGLDTALRDFCTDIHRSGVIRIDYQSIGMGGVQLDQTTAITLFRIAQELVNNTIKHAKATRVIVQMAKTDGQLSLTVEDDGQGFDLQPLEQKAGIGWSNIRHRVEFLRGRLDVRTAPGEGCSVFIEV